MGRAALGSPYIYIYISCDLTIALGGGCFGICGLLGYVACNGGLILFCGDSLTIGKMVCA